MRRCKVLPEEAARRVRGISQVRAREELVEKTVRPETLAQYKSRLRHMKEFMEALDERRFSIDTWASYCHAMAAEYVTLEGHRAALLFGQRAYGFGLAEGEDAWAGSDLAVTFAKGARYNGGSAKPAIARTPRGAITEVMALALAELVVTRGYSQLHDPILLLMYAALRSHELVCLRVRDWNPGTSSLHIAVDKRHRASSSVDHSAGYDKPVVAPQAVQILERICSNRLPDVLMFPYGRLSQGLFNEEDLLKMIKTASMELGWEPGLQWCIHGLRHGGVQAIRSVLETQGRMDEAPHILQLSASTIPRYAEPNEERKRHRDETREGPLDKLFRSLRK